MNVIDQILELISALFIFVSSIMFTVSVFAGCARLLGFDLFAWNKIIRMILLSGLILAIAITIRWMEDHI